MATMNVLDAGGATVAVEKPLPPGRTAAATSRPVTLSNEDLAAITAINTALAATLTVGLPTGAATAANQSTIAATLAALLAIEQDTTTPMPVQAQQPTVLVTLTPTLDTSGAYSANDVLFGTTALSLARANNLCVGLESINAVDKTKQNPALTLFFFSSNVTSAAANAAEALSDADALSYLGHVSFAAGDWKTMANNSRACKTSINLIFKPGTGSTNVWVVGILDAGSPTFGLGDLQFGIGVVQS